MKKYRIFIIAIAFLIAGPAHATRFGFDNITNNNTGDASIGEMQLFVDVTPDNSQVLFTFLNIGLDVSSITKVHFDDDADVLDEDGISSIWDSPPGVDFSEGTNPGNLPGGGDISPKFGDISPPGADYKTPAYFWAKSQGSPPGVHPGETLGILFDLLDSVVFADVIAALESGNLRIGIHVQAFESGGSESFVNNTSPIPEPATMALLGVGLIGLAGIGRKKFFNKR